jgi:O-antigen/teichoic acid export membrane protein
VSRIGGIGADLTKRTRLWAVCGVVAVALGLPLAAVLLSRFGIAGTGFGWLSANAVTALLAYRLARRVSGFVLPVERSLFVVLVGAALGTAAAWHPWSHAVRIAVLAGYGIFVHRVMGVNFSELKATWSRYRA